MDRPFTCKPKGASATTSYAQGKPWLVGRPGVSKMRDLLRLVGADARRHGGRAQLGRGGSTAADIAHLHVPGIPDSRRLIPEWVIAEEEAPSVAECENAKEARGALA